MYLKNLIYKSKKEADRASVSDFRDGVIFNLYNGMLGNRLDELTKSADPPFLFARSRKGSWVQSKQMYTLSAFVKTNGIENDNQACRRQIFFGSGARYKIDGANASEMLE